MYEIKKNVPMPAWKKDKYGLQRMELGDSFEFPKADRSTVNAAVQYAKRRYGLCFTVREIDAATLGCWRVAVSGNQADLP